MGFIIIYFGLNQSRRLARSTTKYSQGFMHVFDEEEFSASNYNELTVIS